MGNAKQAPFAVRWPDPSELRRALYADTKMGTGSAGSNKIKGLSH